MSSSSVQPLPSRGISGISGISGACDHGRDHVSCLNPWNQRDGVKTIDEMLKLRLLSEEQHAQIGAWVAHARTPEAIMQMPAPLWRTLELASVLMNVDADLTQPPALDDLSCS